MSSSSTPKRCLYEVLGLTKNSTSDEIRTAYKKLALQRHPDKLISTGVSESEATSSFQELVNAYEVLSDAKERSWYDSHRNQILFNSSGSGGGSNGGGGLVVPDLFSFFTNSVFSGYGDKGKGFYKVYGDVFVKVYESELGYCKKTGADWPKEAPRFGNLESSYEEVTAFYNYWMGFASSMEFYWADQFDAMQGPNRKSKRVMEEENKKLRKKAKREYNEMVRGLAQFVKKRDKRVIDMQIKRNEEMERKRVEEKQRKKELERLKAEKARNYEEPEWARIDEVEDEMEGDEAEDVVEEKRELYCVVCSKKFKSDKQWKNHEQSKKHKEKVAELKEAFSDEDREFEATKGNRRKEEEEDYLSADEVNELQEKFEESVGIERENSVDENAGSGEEEEDVVSSKEDEIAEGDNGINLGSDDDEASMLEAMLSGCQGRKNKSKIPTKTNSSGDELDFMEYNNTKVSRRNRGRRERGRRNAEAPEAVNADVAVSNEQAEDHVVENNESQTEEPISRQEFTESDSKNVEESVAEEQSQKHPKKAVKKNSLKKKETVSKSKETVTKSKSKEVKGRQKAAAGDSDHVCDKCGQEFFSRTKLHKHLGETGHASLKSR